MSASAAAWDTKPSGGAVVVGGTVVGAVVDGGCVTGAVVVDGRVVAGGFVTGGVTGAADGPGADGRVDVGFNGVANLVVVGPDDTNGAGRVVDVDDATEPSPAVEPVDRSGDAGLRSRAPTRVDEAASEASRAGEPLAMTR